MHRELDGSIGTIDNKVSDIMGDLTLVDRFDPRGLCQLRVTYTCHCVLQSGLLITSRKASFRTRTSNVRDFRRVRIGTLLALDDRNIPSSFSRKAVYGARRPTMGARKLLVSGTVTLGIAILLTVPYITR